MDNFQGPYLEVNTISNQIITNENFRGLTPQIKQELISSCYEVISTSKPKKFARQIHHAFYDLSVLPVVDKSGNVTAAVATGFYYQHNKVFHLFQDIIFDNIPIVLFYAEYRNNEFYFRAVNKAFLDVTGLSIKEVIDQNIKDVIPPDSQELVLANYQKAITEKRIIRWEEKTQYPKGVKYGDVSILPVFENNEKCVGLIGTVHDITDRRLTELELEKNFTLLNAVIEGTTDAVFIKDLEGRYIMINSSTARFHNKSREEILGHSDYELALKSVADNYTKNDREVAQSGETKTFLEEGLLGEKYQCFLSLKGPYRNSDGKTVGIIGLSRDITELKESQRALERSEGEIKTYTKRIQLLSDLSVLFSEAHLDLQSICNIIVEQASLFFKGGAVVELLNDEGKLDVACMNHIDQSIKNKLFELQEIGLLSNGQEHLHEVLHKGTPLVRSSNPECEKIGIPYIYLLPLKSIDKAIGLLKILGCEKEYSPSELTFLRTFTDRSALAIGNAKLFKKANDAIQLREDFIQVASHELRTPLTPLKLQIGLLQKLLNQENMLTTPKGKELFKIIKGADQQIIRLKNLIDDLIDVTKFSTNKIILEMKETNISELITESVSEFRISHQEHQIELDLPEKEILFANVDKHRFKQVLKKLLLNGVQFGLMNPILVSAGRQGDHLEVKIQDFGLGISEIDQERVFDRFERGLSVNSYGGLGMGLYLTRKIIEAHGGKISIESELLKGSTFIIKLPIITN